LERISANQDLSIIKTEDQFNNPKLLTLLKKGDLALAVLQIDAFSFIIDNYCELMPEIRLHVSAESFTESHLMFGFRNGFDSKVIHHINTM